jgi:large subunit ribosomal protein L13
MNLNKTYVPKLKTAYQKEWVKFDAEGEILGKLATKIAESLMGKDKADYTPFMDLGAKVVVTNATKVKVTGAKELNKKYYWHTGYPGGIKEETYKKRMSRKPEEIIRNAVKGMLPKNKFRKHRLANLYIYEGSEHPHTAQVK